MIIGLMGAHRTGKTTLAKAVAETANARFIQVKLSEAQRILGYDSSNQNYSFKERRIIQEGLLDYMAQLLKATDLNYDVIYDRTPLDLIAYVISLANANVLDDDDEKWLKKFIHDCHLLTRFYFNKVYLVQPGIPLVTDNTTSAVSQEGYINHLNCIMCGIIMNVDYNTRTYVIPSNITNLQERIEYVLNK